MSDDNLFLGMFDSIGQKTFLANDPRVGQRTADRPGQEFFAQAGQGRGVGAAEEKRSNGQVELVDQILLEEGAKEGCSAFAGNRADAVIPAELLQHPTEID